MFSRVVTSQSFILMPINEFQPTQAHSWHTELLEGSLLSVHSPSMCAAQAQRANVICPETREY